MLAHIVGIPADEHKMIRWSSSCEVRDLLVLNTGKYFLAVIIIYRRRSRFSYYTVRWQDVTHRPRKRKQVTDDRLSNRFMAFPLLRVW